MQTHSQKTYIIAEAGVNHDGSEARACELIDIAAAAGADAVKFQLFDPHALVTGAAPTASYQAQNLKDEKISQREMLEKLALPLAAYPRLEVYCKKKSVDFLCTPFDHASLQYLIENTRMRYLKLASGEVANGPMLLAAARTGLPVILSTGMSELREVEEALAVLHFGYAHESGYPVDPLTMNASTLKALRGKVIVLHCVSQYPAPASSINLRAMDTMRDAFHLPTGLSDHSIGIAMPVAAVARGAVMIEKHFTHDVKASGPDHAASLSPEDLHAMIKSIREVEAGMGDGIKRCQPVEEDTRAIARRSVVAARDIAAGEAFTQENLVCKRPATGPLSPAKLWDLLGKPASRAYAADAFIQLEELQDSTCQGKKTTHSH